MDPGACDGQTTVCPLWLLAHAFTGLHFGGSTLQTGAVEFPAFELLRVDTIQAAHIEHDYLLPAGSLAIGIRLDAAGLAERVMNRALVELVVRQHSYSGCQPIYLVPSNAYYNINYCSIPPKVLWQHPWQQRANFELAFTGFL